MDRDKANCTRWVSPGHSWASAAAVHHRCGWRSGQAAQMAAWLLRNQHQEGASYPTPNSGHDSLHVPLPVPGEWGTSSPRRSLSGNSQPCLMQVLSVCSCYNLTLEGGKSTTSTLACSDLQVIRAFPACSPLIALSEEGPCTKQSPQGTLQAAFASGSFYSLDRQPLVLGSELNTNTESVL